MPPEHLDMYDDNTENNVLFEPVAIEQDPVPMDIITVDNSSMQEQEPAGDASNTADDEFKGTYTWAIENFSRITAQKEHSPKFEIGTHFWRLLIFPKGNPSQSPQHASLSVYLEFTEASFTPALMCPKANFKLHLVNQRDPSQTISKATAHTFSQNETDWGFTQFHALSDVQDPAKGFLTNDTLILKVDITVQRDERYSYDSRKQTGSVGLKNQGATCYMNSLLQYLYNIPLFRKAVYHMPTPENDEASNSIPVALQSVFYKLQYSKTSASTKDLTKSFGWNTLDAFTQHDVQEFNRVLCDKLEEKMKGTRVERAINDLFEGHVYNYIECVNVTYKSTRVESYMDLQLDVKGCKDIYDSFEKYCEMETLDGNNQYMTDSYGLQDARKGVQFEDFPPVLQLQLKRFEYDFQRDAMVKINDRYEFYDELDLDIGEGKYLSPNADRTVRNKYRLHSVLVHSGGVHGGHYYAFIRPKKGDEWLKFDDEKVTKEDAKRALDEQFGGEDEAAAPGSGGFHHAPTMKFTKYSNAYMLVYVRESDWDRIYCDVGKDDLAMHLRMRLEMELSQKEQRHRDKMEAHLYCNLKIATDKHMQDQVGKTRFFDLIDSDKVSSYRLKKQLKFRDFKLMVERDLGIPMEQQRYWTWRKRENKTYRPDSLLPNQSDEQDLMDLRDHRENKGTQAASNKSALMDIRFYLEGPSPDMPLLPTPKNIAGGNVQQMYNNPDAVILVFLKYYDPTKEELTFLSHTYLKTRGKVADLFPLVRQLAGLSDSTELQVYEEVKQEPTVMVELLEPASTPQSFEGQNGDILLFQPLVTASTSLPHPTVRDFLIYIRNRRRVELRTLERHKEEGFRLELRSNMSYDEVVERVARQVNATDGTFIRLTPHSAYMHAPQTKPLKYRERHDLEHMLQHGNHTTDILYYETLDMPLPDLEKLKTIKLYYYNDKVELVADRTLRVPKDSNVEHVLQELKAALEVRMQPKHMRLLEVHGSSIFKEMASDAIVDGIDDGYWQLRAEEVSEEDVELASDPRAKKVQVQHTPPPREGSLQTSSVFGDPFYIMVHESDGLADVRARIQRKLGVPDEEFSKWKLCVLHRGVSSQPPEYLEDEEGIFNKFDKAQALDPLSIGLEHDEKGHRRQHTRQQTYERAIKIYN